MKVTKIETTISWAGLRNWIIVKVTTDKGIIGWGEATLERFERPVEACVHQYGELLIGEDPLRREHHWQRLYRHHSWRGGPVCNSALAGLDQALWDIAGKAYNAPVYQLLGGKARDSLRLYTHVGIYNSSAMVSEAQKDVEDGFTAVKTGAWKGAASLPEHERIATFAERVGELRKAVGDKVDIMVDDHGRGSPASATRLIRALEPLRIHFLEEAIQPDDIEGLQRLRDANPMMDLAAGERLYSKWDFRRLLEGRYLDIIQPDICHAGGITECRKIAAMAEAYYVNVAPHNPQGPISTAAAAHLGISIPNFHILEYVRQEPFRDASVKQPWEVVDGHLFVPDTPGLGVEMDEDYLAEHPANITMTPSDEFGADGTVRDR